MTNFPKTVVMKRNGKYRRCYFIQPYLNGGCYDVFRCVLMELV